MWSSCSNIFIILQILFTKIAENQLRASTTLGQGRVAGKTGVCWSWSQGLRQFRTQVHLECWLEGAEIVHGDEYWSHPRAEWARSSFTLRQPNDPGEPTAESWQPRSLSAKRRENYSSSVRTSPGDANRRSIGRGYSVLNGGLQYSYNRKYQTPGVSALTVRCSQLHMSRAGSLFGSISRHNNSLAITGELVPHHWNQ